MKKTSAPRKSVKQYLISKYLKSKGWRQKLTKKAYKYSNNRMSRAFGAK